MTLADYVRVLRTRVTLWVTFVVLGVIAAGLFNYFATVRYTAVATSFVAVTVVDPASPDNFQNSQFAVQRVKSYARLLTGEDLAERVIGRLDLPDTADEFRERIDVTVESDTVLIDVTVSDTSPARARDVAAALGREFAATVEALEPHVASGSSPVRVTVTDQPN